MKLLDKNPKTASEPAVREKWTPLGNLVLATKIDAPEFERGIALSEMSRRMAPFQKGRVVATGPGQALPNGAHEPTGVVEGDLIVYSGPVRDVKINGEDFIIMESSQVGFVVAEEKP